MTETSGEASGMKSTPETRLIALHQDSKARTIFPLAAPVSNFAHRQR